MSVAGFREFFLEFASSRFLWKGRFPTRVSVRRRVSLTGFGEFFSEFASSRFLLEGPFSNSGIGSLTGFSCRIRRILHPGVRVFSLSLEGQFSNSGIGSLTGVFWSSRLLAFSGRAVFKLAHRFVDGCLLNSSWSSRLISLSLEGF